MTQCTGIQGSTIAHSSLGKTSSIICLYVAAAILALLPLTLIDVPMIADYPNHLARMRIVGETDPILSQHYQTEFQIIPNLAMDLIVPALAKIMPLDVAGRLFLGAILLITLSGVIVLHKALFQRLSTWPLLAILFVYHAHFMAGLTNFSLGLGLMLWATASWVRHNNVGPWACWWRGFFWAILLFVCHIVALGAFALILAGYELWAIWHQERVGSWRLLVQRGLLLCSIFLVPVILFLNAVPLGDGSLDWTYASWQWKIKALLAPVAHYHLPLDAATAFILAVLLVLGLVFRWLNVAFAMIPACMLLALAFVVAPKGFLSGGLFDQRFVSILALLFVASTAPQIASKSWRRAIAAFVAVLTLVRFGVLMANWVQHRDDLAELRQAVDHIEPGSHVLVAVAGPLQKLHARVGPSRHYVFHHGPQMVHLPTLAVIEKSAFVQMTYALPGQQPIRATPAYAKLVSKMVGHAPTLEDLARAYRQSERPAASPAYLDDWWESFDYVFVVYAYHLDGEAVAELDLPMTQLFDGELLDGYAIN